MTSDTDGAFQVDPIRSSPRIAIPNEYFDDFNNDDDAFFESTPYGTSRDSSRDMDMDLPPSNSSFGMLSLSNSYSHNAGLPLLFMDSHDHDHHPNSTIFSHLNDPNSSHRTVALACLTLRQLLRPDDSSTPGPFRIRSSRIHHTSQHFELVLKIQSSLTACLRSHALSQSRSLAAFTLGWVGSSIHPPRIEGDRHDSVLYDVVLSSSRSLLSAALEDDDDGVSIAALEALGMVTLNNDRLEATIAGIMGVDGNVLVERRSRMDWNTVHSATVAELRFKIWNRVFPNLQRLLARLTTVEPHRAILPITACLENALSLGPAISSRGTIGTKISHGKRGWRENDAEGMARDFVEGMLLPAFRTGSSAAAAAAIRLSEAHPTAPWRAKSSRCAVAALLHRLNSMMSDGPPRSAKVESMDAVSFPLSFGSSSAETIAGTAALLIVGLRGIPLRERTVGLVSALRATLVFVPMAFPVPCGMDEGGVRLDVPLFIAGEKRRMGYRLGRIGLLTEIALSVMVDGNWSTNSSRTGEFRDGEHKESRNVVGARAIVLNGILRSNYLASFWNSQLKSTDPAFRPVDELIWTFCSVLLQVEQHRERVFSKDFSFVMEWSNLALVMLDTFAKFVCLPATPSPFFDAAFAAYTDVLANSLKQSGLSPPYSLSIRDNLLPVSFSMDNDSTATFPASHPQCTSVVGGPGRQMPQVSVSLSTISENIVVLRNKAHPQTEGNLFHNSAKNIALAAVAVDAWVGRCIMNHDSKHSNEAQLESGPNLLTLVQSEMTLLLMSLDVDSESSSGWISLLVESQPNFFDAIIHLFRVCIASLEAVANMSVILWNFENNSTRDDVEALENKIGTFAVAIVNTIVGCAKDGLDRNANVGRDFKLLSTFQQVAIDANDALLRITEFARSNTEPISHEDDIARVLPATPILSSREGSKGKKLLQESFRIIQTCSAGAGTEGSKKNVPFNDLSCIKKLPSTMLSHYQLPHQCSFFMYHHARLVLARLVTMAAKTSALALSSKSASAPKRVHAFTPHRLSQSFGYSVIEEYRRARDLPLLIPVPPKPCNLETDDDAIVLTGCADPVSLIMSYEIRRQRRADSSEDVTLVVTMRLYNLTAVPIRHGVRLDLRTCPEFDDRPSFVSSAFYKNEIKAGDFITWELCYGNCRTCNLTLQPWITFRNLEQDPFTHRWVSGGENDDPPVESNVFSAEDYEEGTVDVTISCKPTIIPSVALLQPCPLVFLGSSARRDAILHGPGDGTVFCFLWSNMGVECGVSFACEDEVRVNFNVRRGWVVLDADPPSTGCAFITLDGFRVLCILETNDEALHTLRIRSDSSEVLRSLVGTSRSQTLFISFLFGRNIPEVLNSAVLEVARPEEHDFPSVMLAHNESIYTLQ